MVYDVVSKGKGLPDDSQTIGQQAIPVAFNTGDQQDSKSYSFEGAVSSEAIGAVNLTDDAILLASDDEQVFTALSVSCLDDTGIMLVVVLDMPSELIVFESTYVTSKDYTLNFSIARPRYAKIQLYNLSDATVTFRGTFSIVTRKKEED